MKSIIKLYILGIIALSLFSCSKNNSDTSVSSEVLPLEFAYGTRATTDSSIDDYATLSFSMFPMSSLTAGTSYGIYSLLENNDGFLSYITPLNASTGTYTMCIASTGAEIAESAEDGDYGYILPQPITNYTSCYGYKIYRTESVTEPNLYLSSGITVSVNGILLNDAYSVDLTSNDDAVMRKHISRIYLQIKSLNDVEEDKAYSIEFISVRDLLETAFYCPMHTFHYNESPDKEDSEVQLYGTDGSTSFVVSSTTAIELTDAAENGNNYIEVISGDYSEVYEASTSEMLYTTPKLVIKLENKEEIELPIKANLDPQTEYTYTLTMATTYITVTVIEASWGDGTSVGGSVESAYTYTVDISDDSWNNSYDDIVGTI